MLQPNTRNSRQYRREAPRGQSRRCGEYVKSVKIKTLKRNCVLHNCDRGRHVPSQLAIIMKPRIGHRCPTRYSQSGQDRGKGELPGYFRRKITNAAIVRPTRLSTTMTARMVSILTVPTIWTMWHDSGKERNMQKTDHREAKNTHKADQLCGPRGSICLQWTGCNWPQAQLATVAARSGVTTGS